MYQKILRNKNRKVGCSTGRHVMLCIKILGLYLGSWDHCRNFQQKLKHRSRESRKITSETHVECIKKIVVRTLVNHH